MNLVPFERVVMKIKYGLTLLLAICVACPGRRDVLKVKLPRGATDCQVQGNFLLVSGMGKVSQRDAGTTEPANLNLLARRAAIVDAQRNTLRCLGLARRVQRGGTTYETLGGIVKGAQAVREETPAPDTVHITLKVPLNGPGSLAEGLHYSRIIIKK